MSLLIKGLKMPKEDELLYIRIHPSGKVTIDMDLQCKQVAEAFELPNHGDLIDRDVMKYGFCVECTLYPDRCLKDNCDWGSIYHLEHAPIVIPAERGLRDGQTAN